MNYKDAVQILTSQAKFQIKLGLSRVLAVLKLLNNPQNKIKVIHIAGTNGKGSVASMLAKILECSGFKTGLYTSPHLVNYTERFKINSTDITKNDFCKYINLVCQLADENNIELTEFEILTVCAFKYFYDENVDYAVIETGMGGRFDATNTVENPILEIITSISFDHTDRLGNTIQTIATEKAGIIKKNSAVIISKNNQGFDIIKESAKQNNALLLEADSDIKTIFENGQNNVILNDEKFAFNLLGIYQNQNLALVLKSAKFLNIPEIAVKNGLKKVKWSARFEYIKKNKLIIDGAHNPDAAIQLRKSLDYYFPDEKRIFIYSTLNTKDYITIAKELFRKEDTVYFLEFHHKNAVSFEEYSQNINWLKIKKLESFELDSIIYKDELKIICGSLYMIGELYNNLLYYS